MAPAFWLGLFWRRMTVAGAWGATLVALAILYTTSTAAFHTWAVDTLPESMIWADKFRDSWQIFFYLSGGFIAGIVISLFSKRVSEAKLDRVYACLRTPVDESEPHASEPFSLPEGLHIPPVRKLINHPDLEIPMPTTVGMVGFAVLWACVGGLIWFVFQMSGWGA